MPRRQFNLSYRSVVYAFVPLAWDVEIDELAGVVLHGWLGELRKEPFSTCLELVWVAVWNFNFDVLVALLLIGQFCGW